MITILTPSTGRPATSGHAAAGGNLIQIASPAVDKSPG